MKSILLTLALLFASNLVSAKPVKIKITNLKGEKGQMALAVFNDARYFPDQGDGAIFSKTFPVPAKSQTLEVSVDLTPGKYAFSVFLDKNSNDKLDTKLMGIPKEPFGFSKNPTLYFSAPDFEDCEVSIGDKDSAVEIRLKRY